MAFDQAGAGDVFFTRMYFDSDHDGDLTDEKPIDGMVRRPLPAPAYLTTDFPPVDMMITIKGTDIPYCFRPTVTGLKRRESLSEVVDAQFTGEIAGIFCGSFQVDAHRYTLTLNDRNGNGWFDDCGPVLDRVGFQEPAVIRFGGDMAYLTEGDMLDPSDGMPLGNLLFLHDRLFGIKVDIGGEKIILTEIKKSLAPLKIPLKVERLALYEKNSRRSLMAFRPKDNIIMLPTGNYRLLQYQALRTDEQGDLWRLAAGGTQNSPAVLVAPNRDSHLSLGEPYLPLIYVPPASLRPSGGFSLLFYMEGAGREIFTDLSHIAGIKTKTPLSNKPGKGDRPLEPSYTIVKPDGEIVARGSFGYG
jgi:hypothetical protein